MTAEENELKSKRKQIQEKLIKFATRIPVFMYLTDYREQTLKDVITQLEPGLFKKVTGLTVKDFELLVSLGVFNDALMNDAVYKFRRYEDSSLTYAGVNRHEGERVGLFDTTLSDFEYMAMAQEESMVAPNGLSKRGTNTGIDPTDSKSTAATAQSARDQEVLHAATATASIDAAPLMQGTKERRDWIDNELDDSGLDYRDERPDDGCLWVIDVQGASSVIERLNGQGASFKQSRRGSKATDGRPSWWLKGYPKENAGVEDSPIVTEGELHSLHPGDTIFHKAFGYGEIVDLGESYVEVTFESDKREKRPSRKFMFPSAFYQGLLRIV
jgi:hypothetical protein